MGYRDISDGFLWQSVGSVGFQIQMIFFGHFGQSDDRMAFYLTARLWQPCSWIGGLYLWLGYLHLYHITPVKIVKTYVPHVITCATDVGPVADKLDIQTKISKLSNISNGQICDDIVIYVGSVESCLTGTVALVAKQTVSVWQPSTDPTYHYYHWRFGDFGDIGDFRAFQLCQFLWGTGCMGCTCVDLAFICFFSILQEHRFGCSNTR